MECSSWAPILMRQARLELLCAWLMTATALQASPLQGSSALHAAHAASLVGMLCPEQGTLLSPVPMQLHAGQHRSLFLYRSLICRSLFALRHKPEKLLCCAMLRELRLCIHCCSEAGNTYLNDHSCCRWHFPHALHVGADRCADKPPHDHHLGHTLRR